jgi:BirA family biotin operon repressor/biotin-[acetyl-CoA-carboxylase] ligase
MPEPALRADQIQRHLTSRRLGRVLRYFGELDSTNTTACELAESGAVEGTVVIAESQRRGRGRLGRSWVSPPFRNLYSSVVLRPTISASQAPLLTLVAGLAAAETVENWTSRVAIKWPNDLLVDGCKLAGILTEMVAEENAVRFVILGIGVNLNGEPSDWPAELRGIATSLREVTGERVDRAVFTALLLNRLELRYDLFLREGFAAIAQRWEAYSCLTGKPIVVQSDGERIQGIALGIADDGALRLRMADGSEQRIVSGDVTVSGGHGYRRGSE